MAACANQVAPTGGPKDSVPPQIVKAIPENQTLLFQEDEIVFIFDEFIKTAAYEKEIFISPYLEKRPKIIVINKKLKIKFQEPLRDSTTYVITLTDIADYYGNNKLESSYTYAFSTGSVLDSMELSGKVTNPITNKGEEGITLLLFDPDSIVSHDFMKKKPLYISKSDKSGNFYMPYLSRRPYAIYGVDDADKSNSYSQVSEKIALTEEPLIVFPDSSVSVESLSFYTFLPDEEAPRIKKYDWLSDSTLYVELNERILVSPLKMAMTDTLGGDSLMIERWNYVAEPDPFLLISSSQKRTDKARLILFSLTDSLGNTADTTLEISGKSVGKIPEKPLVQAPKWDQERKGWTSYLPFLLGNNDSSWISLRDTGTQNLPIRQEISHYQFFIGPKDSLSYSLPYNLKYNGKLFQSTEDTLYSYPVNWPDTRTFGSLEGHLVVEEYDGPVVLSFLIGNKITFRMYERNFNYPEIAPESYSIQVILDTDSNQCWTPGSLYPYRMPEKIILHTEQLSIRPNWSLEDHEIFIPKRSSLALDSLQNDTLSDPTQPQNK